MLEDLLAYYIHLPSQQIRALTAQPALDLCHDENYLALISTVRVSTLQATLDDARATFDLFLPDFKTELAAQYPGFPADRISSYLIANWLIGYLQYPDQLERLLEAHQRVPPQIIRDHLPTILSMLEHMAQANEAWQRALSVLGILLVSQRA